MSNPKPTTPGRVSRAQDQDKGWREKIPGLLEKLEELANCLSDDSNTLNAAILEGVTPANIIRRAAHLIRSTSADTTYEERAAWDAYAASWASANRVKPERDTWTDAESAAKYACALLEERRKIFPARSGT